MTLWNIIRDFFVQYIFGGTTSKEVAYASSFGSVLNEGNPELPNNTQVFIPFNAFYDDNTPITGMSFADWLSTIATIITLCAICFFLFLFVRWLFRLTAGLIQCRG